MSAGPAIPAPAFGRPPGEVRQALLATLRLAGPLSTRDAAARAQVGLSAAQRTMDNALRAGAVLVVGHEKRPHCKKWVALYQAVDPAPDVAPEPEAGHAWATLGRFWHSALG